MRSRRDQPRRRLLSRSDRGGLALCAGSCDRLDLVGTEAGPVVLGGDDHRSLDVAERLDLREGVGVLGDVDDVVGHRSEEHTSELQSRGHLVCRLLLEKKKEQPYRTEKY